MGVACGYNDKSVKNESASTKIEMCDLQTGTWTEWKDCALPRGDAAILHEDHQQLVYLGGGSGREEISEDDTGYSIECFDMHKNEWKALPNCNLKHHWHAIMWKNEKNALCIASTETNG